MKAKFAENQSVEEAIEVFANSPAWD